MVPNFDTKHWDREKILDCVIGDQPLDDQQIAFLDYFEEIQEKADKYGKWDTNKDTRNSRQRIANKRLQKAYDELKAQQQSDRDSSTWWHNRYKSQVNINKDLRTRLNHIKDYVNFLVLFDQHINGKFSETPWGQDIISLIGED